MTLLFPINQPQIKRLINYWSPNELLYIQKWLGGSGLWETKNKTKQKDPWILEFKRKEKEFREKERI